MLLKKSHLITIILILFSLPTDAKIYVVSTAALLTNQADHREKEYIQSLRIIKKLGFTPYIIEACKKKGPTFFERYTPHVFYSTMNDPVLHNKGVNEGKTMLEGLKAFHFEDDDIIIKTTGRYHFISDYFVRMVKNNPNTDAFFLLIAADQQVLTSCFAMRYKHLITMLESFDYNDMETNMISIETICADYIKNSHQQNTLRVLFVDKVDIQGRMFFWGHTSIDKLPLSTW